MPVTSLQIGIMQLDGDDTFTETMDGIGIRLADFVAVYDELYAAFHKIEAARFDAEGPGWAELAESTVKGRHGSAHPILVRTGALKKALTDASAPHALLEPMPDGLFMGVDDWVVAAVHQSGTDRAGRDHNVHIPARPLVDISEADSEVFTEILSTYFYDFGLTAEADSVFSSSAEGL